MSTITTINGSDQPVNSRTVINNNFANLNSTKKEDSMSTNKLLGRNTVGNGVIEEITLGTGLSMTGNTINVTAGTGDMVLASAQTNSGLKTFLDTTFGLRNVANTFTGFFTNAITAARTWTLPDSNTIIPIISQLLTFSGPTAARTIILPDANFTVAKNDGSNLTISGQAIGDLAVASSTTAYGKVADVAVGQVLVSGGVGVAPAYSATPLITSIDIGNADTTISRVSAGKIAIEGVNVGTESILSNSQSANYTTVLLDAGKSIDHPATDANARTFTIDSNANVAFPIGTCITFTNMTAQVITIAITTDTMYLAGTGTTGSRSLAQYGIATAKKQTSTTWLISGNGLT